MKAGHFARKLLLGLIVMSASLTPALLAADDWKLVWNDEFNEPNRIDTKKWSPCGRGTSDWNNTATDDPRCYVIRDGTLRLLGLVNDWKKDDDAKFLTGAIQSKGKFSFQHGKIGIRARFKSAKGAWPALWMLGEKGGWPGNGEIDLMEHLNHDDMVYQTVHSKYTHTPEGKQSPRHGGTAKIKRDDYNIYGAEWNAEKIIFTVNGKPTLTYPRIAEKGPEQWPFDQPFYIILSMQIGGQWVGEADPKDYPAWLEIDWVRVYALK